MAAHIIVAFPPVAWFRNGSAIHHPHASDALIQSGVSQSIISSIESGGREPTLSVLERLCIPMDIRLSEFVAIAVGESDVITNSVSPIAYKFEHLDISDQKIVEALVDSLYSKAHGDDKKSSENVG